MSKFIAFIKIFSTIVGLLSCVFFSSLALYFLYQGYRPSDCVTIPVMGIEIPFCRQVPVSQPTQITFIESPTIAPTLAQPAIIFTDTPVPPQPIIPTATLIPPQQPTQPSLSLGENFLINSNFENQIQNSWEWSASISIEPSYNGTQAVCSTQNNANDGFLWVGIGQNVPVVSGQTYLAKAWLKLENSTQANLQIWWLDSSGKRPEVFDNQNMPIGPIDGNWDWAEKSGTVQAPSWAVSARVMVFHGVIGGTTKVAGSKVCIDDIVFAPIR